MRIGELSERTGTPRRLLRYYEEQELLVPGRAPNGYRDYAEGCVDRVLQIRGMLDAGLSTRVIKQVLPCVNDPRAIHVSGANEETIATLEHERERMADRIRCLTRSHDAITGYLEAVRRDRRSRGEAPVTAYAVADSAAGPLSVTEAA
ncbi:MerR family transcriptional regulator [Streptomyces nitrosporeus]|uniref:MerR family transcriptional regulator n=1 Tax=Streptomyces nitrosporeus TaxID=28894 RepID=A0A5J6FCD1_9ACTN|nr:MerR family transcriptional regulator [Streptomyces nitrosporeus]QEU73164.1 MerR family transcriptional regulator [Streptomyces nitrosporeus]GGZ10043.1 MerR family transcriptional regulator [Streptomyces nitrosporeus]